MRGSGGLGLYCRLLLEIDRTCKLKFESFKLIGTINDLHVHTPICCIKHTKIVTGFVQKHENKIPGLFLVFKDSISLTFMQFLIVFAGNGDSEIGRTSFLSPEYFHYGIDKYQDYR